METPTLDSHRTEWLSLIRYQLMNARQEASSPAPLTSMALNTMQDAVESMLRLTGESTGVVFAGRDDFDNMLAKVVAKVGEDSDFAGYSSSLKSMNRARVNFKHNGNRADESTVRRHLDTAESAVDGLARSIFGVELADVSLLLLVPNRTVRAHLEASARHRSGGDHGESLFDLAIAFDELLRDHEARKSRWRGYFSTKPRGNQTSGAFRSHDDPLKPIIEWLDAIDEQLRVISMGVDAQAHAAFRALTPRVSRFLNGGMRAHFRGGVDDIAIDDEAYARSVKFVIDTALRLSASDFEVPENKRFSTTTSFERTAQEIEAFRTAAGLGDSAVEPA